MRGADIGAGLFAIHDVNPESGTYDTECAGRSNMTNHHQLDPYPIPKEKSPLFINEPWLLDKTLVEYPRNKEPDEKDDNIRVYVPLDLNREAILRRLNRIIYHYKKANEANELEFCADVNMLIYQIEIYDQVWYVRHKPEEGRHSREAKELVEAFVAILENIPDGCAECFPFETIDELKREYLGQNEGLI